MIVIRTVMKLVTYALLTVLIDQLELPTVDLDDADI